MAPEVAKDQVVEVKPKIEKQTNCLACNKLIKKLKVYYRNGKFYCSKRCWRTFMDKAKAEVKGTK